MCSSVTSTICRRHVCVHASVEKFESINRVLATCAAVSQGRFPVSDNVCLGLVIFEVGGQPKIKEDV